MQTTPTTYAIGWQTMSDGQEVQTVGDWLLSRDTDPFNDQVTTAMLLNAEYPFRGWLDEFTPSLIVRCSGGTLEIFINIDTQFEVEYGADDTVSARIRFNTDSPSVITMDESTSGEAAFFRNPEGIMRQMLNANSLLFGFTPYNAGPADTEFDLTGLRQALDASGQTCF
jgi:hypothetical protein